MRMRLIGGVLVAAIVAGACASGGSSGTPAAGAVATPSGPRGSATLITEAEIAAANLETIYDVIQRLRPNMFRTRGGGMEASAAASSSVIKVYLNGSPIGDISMLRSIQASGVKQVQYLNAADATTRFGTGVDAGAILVTSK